MNILAVDTSTEVMHLTLETETQFESRTLSAGLKHSENLVPEMMSICERAGLTLKDLDLLVCTKGPGSFTGLRIAMAACKGIALGANKPLVSVSTLQTMQEPVKWFDGAVVPVIDAKKHRYYSTIFTHGERVVPDMDCDPAELVALLEGFSDVLVTGADAPKFLPLLEAAAKESGLTIQFVLDTLSKRDIGEALIQLGKRKLQDVGPDDIGEGPVYIRKSDAEIALEEKLRQGK